MCMSEGLRTDMINAWLDLPTAVLFAALITFYALTGAPDILGMRALAHLPRENPDRSRVCRRARFFGAVKRAVRAAHGISRQRCRRPQTVRPGVPFTARAARR